MQSSRQNSPNSDMHNFQNDGAGSSQYKSHIHSLLGIPEGKGGKLAFSPTLPPVGFKYTDNKLADVSYLTTQSFPDEDIHPMRDIKPPVVTKGDSIEKAVLTNDEVQRHDVDLESKQEIDAKPTKEPENPDGGIEYINLEVLDVLKENQVHITGKEGGQSGQYSTLMGKIIEEHNTKSKVSQKSFSTKSIEGSNKSESKQKQDAVELKEGSGNSDTLVDKTSIEIPGISKERQYSLDISPVKNARIQPDRTEGTVQSSISTVSLKMDTVRTPSVVTKGESIEKAVLTNDEVQRHDVDLESKQEIDAKPTKESENSDDGIAYIDLKASQERFFTKPIERLDESESDQKHNAIDSKESLANSDTRIDQTSIEIPGISKASSKMDTVSTPLSEAQENVSLMNSSLTTAGSKKPDIAKEQLIVAPSSSRLKKSLADDVKSIKSNMNNAVKDNISQERGKPFSVEVKEVDKPRNNVLTNVYIDKPNRPSIDITKRIEQFQLTIQELKNKVTELQTKLDKGIKHESRQVSSSPAQSVVIIKQSGSRGRTSAFWERSYLNRPHLRLLR